MTVPDSELTGGLFGALLDWSDRVTTALKLAGVPNRTVEYADLPGAALIKVRPDRDGLNATISLSDWAEPSLALVVRPSDDDYSYQLFLAGDERVAIVCGPPLLKREKPRYYAGLDPEDRDRIEPRLIEFASALFDDDDTWHPSSAIISPDEFIERYFAGPSNKDDEATVLVVLNGPHVRAHLESLDERRQLQDQNAWTRDAK